MHQPESESGNDLTIRSTFRKHRGRILVTYCLFGIENLLRLAQPFALGWAINDLLMDQTTGLIVLIGQHIAHLLIGLWRQVLDTRVFTLVYSDVVTGMIAQQRDTGIPITKIAARSALVRDYVAFFELSIPEIVRAAFSVAGSLIMLAFYDWIVVVLCIALLAPATFLNRWFATRIRKLNRSLNDELEHEVDVIEASNESELRAHFDRLAAQRVRLSNAEALNFGLMELFVLGVIVCALIRTAEMAASAGDVFAVFRYLMLMLIGLDRVPKLIMQISRMRDIQARMGIEKTAND